LHSEKFCFRFTFTSNESRRCNNGTNHRYIMKLSKYETIEEISNFFDCEIINKLSELKEFLKTNGVENSTNEQWKWYRGANDGSFKMYSSAQREFILRGLYNKFADYNEFLKGLFEKSKTVNDGLLPKMYDSTRQIISINGTNSQIGYNSFWVFSFLQHYGCPSPLIDFTGSFKASLFFAWHNAKYIEGDYNLSNYIQINYFDTEETRKNNFCSIMEEAKNECRDIPIKADEFNKQFSFFVKRENKIFYLASEGFSQTHEGIQSTPDIEFNVLNPNIIAQNGGFIINYDSKKTVEELWKECKLPQMKKVLIHKSLLGEIEDFIKQDINQDIERYYYPKEEQIAEDAFHQSLK
jgi:hypothetical protein